MSISRPSARLRQLAASTGALALAGTLALSGVAGGGVEVTEAAWSDTEVAQATVTASWPISAWAKQTTSSYTNYGSFSERSSLLENLSWDESSQRSSPATGTNINNWTDTYGNVRGLNANFGPVAFGVYAAKVNEMRGCVQASPLLQKISTDITGCTGGANYQLSDTQVRARGYGRSSAFANPSPASDSQISWIIADDVRTRAECRADGTSSAGIPQAGGSGKNFIRLRASSDLTGDVSDANDKLVVPRVNERIVGWVEPKDWQDGRPRNSYWRYTVTSRAISGTGWALSDLYVSIDIFRVEPRKYLGTYESVMSRSECAVNTPGRSRAPYTPTFTERVEPAFPPLPLPQEASTQINTVTGEVASMSGGRVTLNGMRDAAPTTTELPPTTTVTSPLENATASETTTSGPPNPSGEDESPTSGTSTAADTSTTRRTTSVTSKVPTVTTAPKTTTTPPATQVTTSTSAAPATEIPDAPGPLSPAARLEDVGTATVDGDELVVVAPSDTARADARQGLAALEIWLNGGDPGATWTTFASTDPAADGWRWAAVNRRTGAVVYIR